jgi:hypothetical protein
MMRLLFMPSLMEICWDLLRFTHGFKLRGVAIEKRHELLWFMDGRDGGISHADQSVSPVSRLQLPARSGFTTRLRLPKWRECCD